MGANDVQIQIIARDMASTIMRQIDSQAQSTARNLSSLGGAMSTVNRVFANAAGVAAGIAGFQGISATIEKSIGSAINFAKQIEVSEIGMAGILMSMTQIDGRSVQWNEALQISKAIITKLNDEALRTAATSEELVGTFRAILGPALNAKMTIGEIIELTTTAVNAVKSVMPNNADMQRQVIQEIRDLVQGGIQPASSTLATALGLKDSDIQKAKESSEGLFRFLMDRLKGFELSAPAYAKTWQGLMDQIKEGVARSGASGMSPLFAAVKEELNDIAMYFVAIDNETKKVSLNPELIANLRSASETAVKFGREVKDTAQTIGVVAVPAARLLGGAVGMVAENAKAVTMAVGGWMILRNVSVIYADIAAVTAGATTAQTFLGRAALETQIRLEAQAATARLAGATMETAAVAAAMGQHRLAAAIMAVNAAQVQGTASAAAMGATTVSATAVAGTAARNLLGTVWALAGGWVGVAVATGFAANALLDYFDKKNRIESYNPKTKVYRTELPAVPGEGPQYLLEKDVDPYVVGKDEFGADIYSTRRKFSAEEYAGHYKWLDKQEELLRGDYKADIDALTKGLTALFGGQGGGGKGAEKAYEEAQRLNDKVADMVARINEKVAAETTTVFETASMKVRDEIANMKRDLDKSALDFAKYGIDVSGVLVLMDKYEKEMVGKAERERSQRMGGLRASTASARATAGGDDAAVAEAEYQATLIKLEKEREAKFKEVARSRGDAEAQKAVQDWLTAETLKAAKIRDDAFREAEIDKYQRAVEHNNLLLVLEGRNQAAVDELNRRVLNAKISYLDQEMAKYQEGSKERIQLEREKSDTIVLMEQAAGRDINQALDIALKQRARGYVQWSDEVSNSMQSIEDSFIQNNADILNGAKQFTEAYQNIWDTMINELSRLIVKKWYEQTVKKYLEDFSGNLINWALGSSSSAPTGLVTGAIGGVSIIGQNATGTDYWRGGLTWVGEREPELLNLPRGTSITPASKLKTSSSAPNVKINVINNTGTQARVRQETNYDSESQTMVVSLMMDAIDNNVGGARDYFSNLKSTG